VPPCLVPETDVLSTEIEVSQEPLFAAPRNADFQDVCETASGCARPARCAEVLIVPDCAGCAEALVVRKVRFCGARSASLSIWHLSKAGAAPRPALPAAREASLDRLSWQPGRAPAPPRCAPPVRPHCPGVGRSIARLDLGARENFGGWIFFERGRAKFSGRARFFWRGDFFRGADPTPLSRHQRLRRPPLTIQ